MRYLSQQNKLFVPIITNIELLINWYISFFSRNEFGSTANKNQILLELNNGGKQLAIY